MARSAECTTHAAASCGCRRYPVFFADLLRDMPADHPARPRLEAAHECVASVTRSVNAAQSCDASERMRLLVRGCGSGSTSRLHAFTARASLQAFSPPRAYAYAPVHVRR